MNLISKEFVHIFRDSRTMMILLVMPAIQIILFGFAITTEVKNVPMVVFNPSGDDSVQPVIEQLQASGYFTLVGELDNRDEIQRVFQEGEAHMAVIFDRDAIQLIIDASDPNQAMVFGSYVSNIINRFQVSGFEIRALYNPQMKSSYNFVPGVMGLIITLICAMMTSISIVREKEKGTMEVLLASPIRPVHIIAAKMTPYFVLSIINLATILSLSIFVLGVPVTGNFAALVSVSLLFTLTTLSLGLLISSIASTQPAALLISGMGLMMPTMLLSGMIFPIESMPCILQCVSVFFPARWYVETVRKLMIQGVEIEFAAKEIVILTGMTVFLLAVSLKKFSIRIKK
ncbi:MAG: ABC transporter permease [Dysgonamonadaceae bacterium]|jgi:ABC-2 type transport system permease protein|nr:ABC transporter permease [Dysgonamonadaceae bacterium]